MPTRALSFGFPLALKFPSRSREGYRSRISGCHRQFARAASQLCPLSPPQRISPRPWPRAASQLCSHGQRAPAVPFRPLSETQMPREAAPPTCLNHTISPETASRAQSADAALQHRCEMRRTSLPRPAVFPSDQPGIFGIFFSYSAIFFWSFSRSGDFGTGASASLASSRKSFILAARSSFFGANSCDSSVN